MKRPLAEVGWELASVLSLGAWTWWWQQRYGAQTAWALAWVLTLVWEWRLPTMLVRLPAAECLAGRVTAGWRGLMVSWPVFTVLSAGFGWSAPVAAGLAQALTGGWRLIATMRRSGGPGRAGSGQEAWAHALMVAVSAVIVWTTVQSWAFPRIGGPQHDYYNLLAHGFSKGTLAVDLEVKPELRNAPNPWNPAERPVGSAPADITYYDGRFYLYFGVVPTLLLIWPFQLLTGCDLPQAYTVIFFCLGAYWLWFHLWLRFLRDHFPRAGIVTTLAGTGLLGLAGGLLALARRGSVWELPIAAGQFFIALMLLAAYAAMKSTRPRGWLMLAGTALGLAVGSRPTLALAGGCLVVMVLVVAGRPFWGRAWMTRVASAAAWAGVPLAVLMAGLLTYNHLRFGNPLEFGLNYQLTAVYEAKATHFSLSYVTYNLDLYFLRAPSWGRYFPFVHPVDGLPSQPEGYYGYEYVYGALVTNPVIWLALPMLLWVLRPAAWREGRPGPFVALVAAGTLSLTAVLLGFNTAAARYMADFLPGWILLGLTGWAWLENHLADWPRWRRLARSVVAAVAVYGMVVAYGAGAEVHGIFQYFNPAGYARAARLLNTPVTWWENWRGVPAGPLEMTVTFPARGGNDLYEPLLIIGSAYLKDRVEVRYLVPGRIRLMYWPASHEPLFTEELTIEPGRPYRLQIEVGSLYPPEEHPYFDGWSEMEVISRKRWVRLELDGKVVLEKLAVAHEAAPELLQFGREHATDRCFTGTLGPIRRIPYSRNLSLAKVGGDMRLRVLLPEKITPRPQPLASVGQIGEADLLTLRLVDAERFVLGFERTGRGFGESRPFPVPANRVVDLRLRFGSLLPVKPGAPTEVLRRSAAAWVDDQPAAWWSFDEPLARSEPVALGVNAVRSPVPEEFFQGLVVKFQTLPVAGGWPEVPMRGVKILLASAPRPIPGPVLVTGVTGRADILSVQWLPNGRARLVYDHWGQASVTSPEFPWSAEAAHLLEMETPALASLGRGGEAPGRGVLRVKVDGVLRWETEVDYYPVAADTLRIGRNDIGASTATLSWPGVVLDLEPLPGP